MKNTTTARPHQRNGRVRLWLPLADRIAAKLARQYAGLAEADDLQQEARLALCLACDRLRADDDSSRAEREAFLRVSIEGAVRHYLRDRAAMVRVPWRQRTEGMAWSHASLDEALPGGESLLDQLAAPEPAEERPLSPEAAALLDRLPATEAAVLRLRLLEGRSLRQAAADLGCSPAAVGRREARGLARLRATA